jgi:glyoxylase-like metal-dependent hydrolase (beta-lactamase superfamily II)
MTGAGQPPPIPLVKVYDAAPGVPWSPTEGVRCVLAPNPGPFTFTGTNTYIVGGQMVGGSSVAVIDPGPDDDAHLGALLAAIGSADVSHILVTHTHHDHSPLAAKLAERTGAPVMAFGPHPEPRLAPEPDAPEEGADRAFEPTSFLVHGDVVHGDGWSIDVVHTPGHLANHLCFGWREAGLLFTGDHIMGWSTSVISPRDGDLGEFLASCDLVLARPDHLYLSAHGAPIERPHELVTAIAQHRLFRDAQIAELIADGICEIPVIVDRLYPGLDERLVRAARATVLSHLLRMLQQGRVRADRPLAELSNAARFTPLDLT